ncbi:MAG: DUF1080 domain-containing protein, partial [Candidatus Hydrogenedentes bacterium]|nr:DUF1080 domain-containing protein [Candidatus Hydrogenedentota bacterium]
MRNMVIVLALTIVLAAGFATAQQAADPVQGNWKGQFTDKAWKDSPLAVKVVADGRNLYRVFFDITGKDGKPVTFRTMGALDGQKFSLESDVDLGADLGGSCKLTAKGDGAKIAGKFKGKGTPGAFKLDHVFIQSPTLGAKPPANAIVLFDGKNLDAWKSTETPWAIVEGGAMEVRKGNNVTKQEFGDHKLHIEFRTPLLADKRGQARGNSGVYI